MKGVIVIPARFASTRFPGKPLYKIANKSLLQHVFTTALTAANSVGNVDVFVATDDEKIMQHANDNSMPALMTPATCVSGTDRIITAIAQLSYKPNFIINLQGDTPLTPTSILVELIHALKTEEIVTPVMQLGWQELDILRQAKLKTPFSGTTAIINKEGNAIWFSKQIIPAMRNEQKLRSAKKSPIYQHLGIYGYSYRALQDFAKLKPSYYEQLEGLEQLRFIENGYKIKAIPIELANLDAWRGVDTPEDAQFVEKLLLKGST